jgi:hypothetical protein
MSAAATEVGVARPKFVSTLRAALALAGGHVVVEHADGSFTVWRWGLSRDLPDIEALRDFALQVGVKL